MTFICTHPLQFQAAIRKATREPGSDSRIFKNSGGKTRELNNTVSRRVLEELEEWNEPYFFLKGFTWMFVWIDPPSVGTLI